MVLSKPKVRPNNSQRTGQRASRSVIFGGETGSRYAAYAIHTRLGRVQWVVSDVEEPDEFRMASIIRRVESFEKAIEGLE